MAVSERLGVLESEVETWTLDRLTRWMAFFKIQREDEEKAMKEAQRRARFRGGN